MSVLADHRAHPDDHPDAAVPATPSRPVGRTIAEPEHRAGTPRRPRPEQLRADFGAHFEANYQRLVAQLYAITLNPAEAHDVVREAYSRAWRRWAVVGASSDPTAWIRRVAVRSTMRSWRRVVSRIVRRPRDRALVDGGEPHTRALLGALGRLPDPERRAVVLVEMAGVPVAEVAVLEQVPPGTIAARLSRAHRVIGDAVAEAEPVAAGPYGQEAAW